MTSFSTSRSSAPTIAVVVCTHNRSAALERCLRRLHQSNELPSSVVVVDSAPKSSDAQSIAIRYGARYVLSPLKGASRARNIGVRETDTDIVAFLDDDMVPHVRWLNSLTEEFADSEVMAATGPVLNLELIDGSDADLRLAVELAPWGPHRFQIDQACGQWFERTNFGGIGDGNFALRRSAFEKIQGFDERIGRGEIIDTGEEHYAFFRIVELGSKLAFAPHAIVFHPNSTLSRDVLRKQVADSVSYAAFLIWHNPAHSWKVAKFFLEGFFGAKRWWRTPRRSEGASIPFQDKIVSGMKGLMLFWRSLRQTSK